MDSVTDSIHQDLFPVQLGQPLNSALLCTTPGTVGEFEQVNEAPIQDELEPNRLPAKEHLIQFFHLTPAEAELTRLLVAGKSVAECAEHLGISIHTARSHLKKAMSKTKTNRQGALIGLVLSQMSRVDGH